MIRREGHDLRFGTTLSRLFCRKCQSTTLHLKGVCTTRNCGTQFVPEVISKRPDPRLTVNPKRHYKRPPPPRAGKRTPAWAKEGK